MSNISPDPDDSRPAPKKKMKFSYFEPIAGIIFAVVAAVIFYFFPQIIAIVFIGGPLIPTFYAEVIHSLWFPILLWVILRVGVEVAFLVERRYTQRLSVISLIGNVLTAIVTFIIFFSDRIVNVEYIDFVHDHYTDGAAWFGEILVRPHHVIIVIIMISLILESINVIIKGRKAKKNKDEKTEAEAKAD